jgi:hypothetical protein
LEEYVDRWAVSRHLGAALYLHEEVGPSAVQVHVVISGCNQNASGDHAVAIFGLFDVHGAELIESIGEGAGEVFRHVLDDHDAGKIGGQGHEQLAECFGAPGGSADGHER